MLTVKENRRFYLKKHSPERLLQKNKTNFRSKPGFYHYVYYILVYCSWIPTDQDFCTLNTVITILFAMSRNIRIPAK